MAETEEPQAAAEAEDGAGKDEPEFDARPLKVLREIVGVDQPALRGPGMSLQTISRIENGKRAIKLHEREGLARGLGLPAYIFDDMIDFIGYVDRLRGVGGRWSGGEWRGAPDPTVPLDEIAENPGKLQQHQRYLEDARLAEAAGRWLKEFMLRLLERMPGRTYDEM